MASHSSIAEASNQPLSIAVFGASGDLALKKIYPALFALFCQQLLPAHFKIIGYARTELSHDAFRDRIMRHLTCRYVPGEKCEERMQAFLAACEYVSGGYDSIEGYRKLDAAMKCFGPDQAENRLFYMSIPPFLFLDVANTMHTAGLESRPPNAWSRVVLEKPFGSDRASSDFLTENMAKVFTEDQTYRIDHYLGKEVIQNLMVLRFANLIFDPIWNRSCIHHVCISWGEDIGVEGRAGYFDQYGILRDVMQNHLLQIMALAAMEEPIRLDAKYIRDEKVKVLRGVPALTLNDVVIGQYTAGEHNGAHHKGYLEEEGIPPHSITPTYGAAVLKIHNRRWDGVPFLIRAGKGLRDRRTEIRIRFREVPANLFTPNSADIAPNELVIRVQPDAEISFQITTKVPGLNIALAKNDLNLQYASAFQTIIPDAYECLLLDVLEGDRSLFIRADELEAAWDIFTPVLHDLESCTIQPQGYPFGSTGPQAAQALAALHGVEW
ncbi:MAG TPA: glucose-6-phosphate dehydrogenase [Candidatus Hydrogenedentes bacterium]|nr:glucose-6-phosphate dehydrogenase [Candidatus Hydrogenedentota bacterium]